MTYIRSDISVVLCAYTESRWDALVAAVYSIQCQSKPPREVIVVIDHNQQLFERVCMHIPDIRPIENQETRGLSGARNSGVAVAQGSVVAFMDEDAIAAPDWLDHLSQSYAEQHVIGVGGTIEPVWLKNRPGWFPEEFDWVVGCTYRGMPTTATSVRNLIGCNMSFRREVFDAVGGFRSGIGRVGTQPVGCEETEFCIRVRQHQPNSVLLYNPKARVFHQVPSDRANWNYFLARCYAEGISKALVTQLVGEKDGLASERGYALRTLPRGFVQSILTTLFKRNPVGILRAGAIVTGLATTTAGYLGIKILKSSAMGGKMKTGTLTQIKVTSTNQEASPSFTPEALDFTPARILEVELSEPLPNIPASDVRTGQQYKRAVSLVRLYNYPIGMVELKLNLRGVTCEDYARHIWETLGTDITARLRQDGLPNVTKLTANGLPSPSTARNAREHTTFIDSTPLVSIVVATRERTDSLAVCLKSLFALDYSNYEIIVVDNAPRTTATADYIKQTYGNSSQIRYVREDRPGLAVAHNRGLQEVRGHIVAFTDDDVVVDKYWLTNLVQGFDTSENVACVTGMIFPAELETPAQEWIEQYGGFNKGFARRIFDLDLKKTESPLYPYTAGMFGSGANMAFKTDILRKLGGFDPALGAGSKGIGGDDLAAFFEVITRGYKLVYEPAAIVHHWHRRDYAGLRKQAYGYGVGLTAYLMKTLIDNPRRFFEIASKIPGGLIYILNPRSQKNSKKQANYPKELTYLERKGMFYGPVAYLRSRWQLRKA